MIFIQPARRVLLAPAARTHNRDTYGYRLRARFRTDRRERLAGFLHAGCELPWQEADAYSKTIRPAPPRFAPSGCEGRSDRRK